MTTDDPGRAAVALPTEIGTVIHIPGGYGLFLLGEDEAWYGYTNGLRWTRDSMLQMLDRSHYPLDVAVVQRPGNPRFLAAALAVAQQMSEPSS